MKQLIAKFVNYETCSYIIAGVLTTVVDYLVFAVVNERLKTACSVNTAVMAATVVSWIAAVAFAYISNKLAVFKSFDFSPSKLVREASAFVGARMLSGVIVLVFMWVAVSMLGWNEYISKILSSAFNLIFNYAASKLFIFKK